jgi:serine/threonine protein kinase
LINEIKNAIRLNHVNLINYLEVYEVDYGSGKIMQVGVMEYAEGGDMRTLLENMPSNQELKILINDVLRGLVELEDKKIIHRDIKLANILLKYDENLKRRVAKIADFGIAKIKAENLFSVKKDSTSLRGTPAYMAPEVFDKKYAIKDTKGNKKIRYNLDLWALGILIYHLFIKKLPFGSASDTVTPLRVLTNIATKKVPIFYISKIPEPYKTIVKKCLIKDANRRVQSAKELLPVLNQKIIIKNINKSVKTTIIKHTKN